MGRGAENTIELDARGRSTQARSRPARGLLAKSGMIASFRRVTRTGLPVRLDLYHQMDDGISDGWIVDLVEARDDHGPVGYLKIAFIPEEKLQQFYPDALHWAVRKQGIHIGLRDLLDRGESSWTKDDLVQALKATDPWHVRGEEQQARGELEHSELEAMWQERRQQIVSEHRPRYLKSVRYLLNRPYIDYSRVDDGGVCRLYDGAQRSAFHRGWDDPSGENRQRQGIGTLMYETAALWMYQRGMELHASGTQSESARGCWQRFDELGLVRPAAGDAKRTVFNVDELLSGRPELGELIDELDRIG